MYDALRTKSYRRADEAAPMTLAGISFYLTTILRNNRLPLDMPHLLLTKKCWANPKNNYPAQNYLAEFNPSLVQTPASQIPSNLKDKGLVYLASVRAATHHACTSHFQPINRPRRPKSYQQTQKAEKLSWPCTFACQSINRHGFHCGCQQSQ